MNYIDATLMDDEHVIYRSHLHWIIFTRPVMFLLLSFLLSIFGNNILIGSTLIYKSISFSGVISTLFFFMAVYLGIATGITYMTSEYGITNKRVLIKVGWISRRTLEIMLHKIESVEVTQPVLGRILDYGTVIISGTGGSRDPFFKMPEPLEFRKQVQKQISKNRVPDD